MLWIDIYSWDTSNYWDHLINISTSIFSVKFTIKLKFFPGWGPMSLKYLCLLAYKFGTEGWFMDRHSQVLVAHYSCKSTVKLYQIFCVSWQFLLLFQLYSVPGMTTCPFPGKILFNPFSKQQNVPINSLIQSFLLLSLRYLGSMHEKEPESGLYFASDYCLAYLAWTTENICHDSPFLYKEKVQK